MSSSLADLACTVPWCITPSAFEAMLSIAERDPLPTEQIAEAMHGPKALELRNGQRREGDGRMRAQGDVAVIYVDGPIYRYADYFTKVSGGVTTEALARDYAAALDDPSVAAILSVFDSPGGEGSGINELADMLYQARGRKSMIAYVESQAASAAYWIASAHDEIVIDDTALIGSIGTIVTVPDPTKRLGRTIDFVSSQSPRKRPDPTTDGGRKDIQAIADSLTDVFIEKVARNMGVSRETVEKDFGQGGQFVGKQAIEAGMAHRLGSEDGLIKELTTRGQRRRAFGGPFTFQQEESMKVSQFIAGIFTGAKDAGIELEPDAAPAPTTAAAEQAADAKAAAIVQNAENAARDAQSARILELEKHIAAQREAQVAAAALSFADTAVRERRAFPAEHAALVALYVQAARDDDRAPVAEGQPTRIAQAEAMVNARPQHSLSSEIVATNQGGALEQSEANKPMSAERRRELLAMTPMGQAVLRNERAKSA